MKFSILVILSTALGGCAAQHTAVYRGTPADHCAMVAQQRMEDGGLMGYDEQLQKAIYRDTYADCVRWDSAHAIK